MFPTVSSSSVSNSALSILGTSLVDFRGLSILFSLTMRTVFWTVAFVGTVYCAPQLVNLDAIALDFPPSDLIKAPINVVSNILPPASVAAITPLQSISAEKREFEKRDGNCSPYPAGSGPVTSPDTPATFQSNPDFAVCLQEWRTVSRTSTGVLEYGRQRSYSGRIYLDLQQRWCIPTGFQLHRSLQTY